MATRKLLKNLNPAKRNEKPETYFFSFLASSMTSWGQKSTKQLLFFEAKLGFQLSGASRGQENKAQSVIYSGIRFKIEGTRFLVIDWTD